MSLSANDIQTAARSLNSGGRSIRSPLLYYTSCRTVQRNRDYAQWKVCALFALTNLMLGTSS
eukprot:6194040-Pleurochrysis_carterae.AAC.1